jgi:hypothetical protein
MKTEYYNPAKDEILSHVDNKGRHHFDSVMNTEHLAATRVWSEERVASLIYEGRNEDLKRGRFTLNYDRWAFTQLLSRFRVPLRFYESCSVKLRRDIFGEHITDKKKPLLFRFAPATSEDVFKTPIRVRAVLSPSYTVVDDSWLYPLVLDILEEQNTHYWNFSWDTHLTRLLVEFPDLEVRDDDGILYKGGLVISNSETGHSAVWAEPCVYVGGSLIVNRRSLAGQGLRTRLIHRGTIDEVRVTPLVEQAREIAQVGIVQLMEAQQNLVKKVQALKYAERLDVLPKRMYDILAEEWENEQEISRLAAARRILVLAQDLPLFQRVPLEQAAGAYTGVFNKYKSRIAQLIGEINE